MKSMRIFKTIYIVIFFAVCLTPLCLWQFFENDIPIGKTELAQVPSVKNEDGSINYDFFSEFDDYFTEHLPFRPQLVTADNFLKAQLFGGDAGNVVTGKNGYLFSNQTILDYTGETYSTRKINNIARTVKLMENKVTNSGNRFLFTVAPNKNTVYPQYMPARYIEGQESNLSLLSDRLNELNVNYADLKAEFMSIDTELYLKRDTHWNNLGALYGFNLIMDKLGKESKDYNGLEYTYKKEWSGDLDEMLYPSGGGILDYQYYFKHSYDDVSFLLPRLGVDNYAVMEDLMGNSEKNDTLIKTRNLKATGNLLMVRDSFGRAMLPYLIDNYKSTTITRSQPFSMVSLSPNSDTDVVYEIVERNLGDIVKSAPLMEAEKCEQPKYNSIQKSLKNVFAADNTDSYVKIYGILDEKYFTDESRIFITLKSDSETLTYEAFPICETELLGCEQESDYGYSLMIDKNIPNGEYEVSAVITNDKIDNICTGKLGNFSI